ncbi:MAG TPA: methionyl-tRNA formyltransferase [Candidatus Rubrimentiphilum sp.]|nr:methionyl-tRNA formyltransferase [Candidatus Rubrimentiphilum sp.]
MKTLFFGTSDFAVPSLEMTSARTELAGVVTQPDRPAGRGHKLRPPPVKTVAENLRLPIYQPASLKNFAQELRGNRFDFFVVASYGKIIPKEVLDLPELGSLNVHPSLLPLYRGATPIQSALRDGATETGVTIMFMDEGMDTGDIVLQERMPILPGETYGELHDRLARFGAQVLGHAIDLARGGEFLRTPQSGKPTVTRPLQKGDLEIQWSWPAQHIVNHVRALSPSPAARASIAGVPVKVLHAELGGWDRPLVAPGGIVGVRGNAVVVRAGDTAVNILQVIAPNRGPQTGAAFALPLLKRPHDPA